MTLTNYRPEPIDTSHVRLPHALEELTETLARSTHDIWAKQRMADGWCWGPARDDGRKLHPSLIPYAELPESEKTYDRATAMETVKAILALGFRISSPESK